MADSLSTILSKGWDDFKANPILIVPGLLTMIFTYLFIFVILLAFFGTFIPLDLIISGDFTDQMFLESIDFDSINFGNLIAIIGVSFILFFILSVFLSAGLIGMGKETVVNGKTKIGDMFSYGFRYFFKLLLLTIATIVIVSFAIGIPTGIFLVIIGLLLAVLDSAIGIILFIILYLLMLLLIIIVSVVISLFLYFATYALIIDDFGIFESLKISYNLFMNNKNEVFTFVVVMILVSLGAYVILQIFSFVLLLIPILGIVIYAVLDIILMSIVTALTTVWAIRKYYGLTRSDESEDIENEYIEETETPKEEEEEKYSEYSEIEQGILNNE